MKVNRNDVLNYIIILMFIIVSGNKAFDRNFYLISLFLITLFLFIKRKFSLEKKTVIFFTIFISILLMQILKFEYFSLNSYLGMLLIVSSAYLVVKNLNKDFLSKFINVMIIISYISLFFYFIILFFPEVSKFMINNFTIVKQNSNIYSIARYYMGFYTIGTWNIWRNCGPFWEPGAFAGYLIITLIFLYAKDKTIFSKNSLILILTVITTFSTTGYIALVILISGIIFIELKSFLAKIFSIALMLFFIYNVVFSFDFIGSKIENRIYIMKTKRLDSRTSSRFLDVLRDIHDLKNHEFIGRGIDPHTRFSSYSFKTLTARTNGLTDTIVRYGIIFIFIIFFYIYNSFYRIFSSKSKSFLMIVVVLTILQSEAYFNFPIMWSILFLFVLNLSKEEV